MKQLVRLWSSVAAGMAVLAFASSTVSAVVMSDGNFILDPNVTSSFGGETASTNYRLVDAGGETAVGDGSSASFSYTAGFVSQLQNSISMSVDQSSVNLPITSAGESKSATVTVSITTDGAGYVLGVYQDHDLRHATDSGVTIAPISAPVGSPEVWQEGSTTGLGFNLSQSAHVPVAWGTAGSPNYGAIPQSLTTLLTTSAATAAVPQDTRFNFRLATTASQLAGNYSNTVTYIATAGL